MGSRGDSTLGVVGVWECIGGERSLVLCLQCRVKYFVDGVGEGSRRDLHGVCALPTENPSQNAYVSLRLRVQNAVSPQPCVGKLGKSPLLLNFLVSTLRIII